MGPWVDIGDPMHGLKNPWVFPGDAQLFLGVLTYVGDLWNKYDKWVKINNFIGTPVLFYLAYRLTSSDILSGISSDILSGTSSDIFWHSIWHIYLTYLSGTLSGISSDILSGIFSDILSGISFWHSIWHIFWHSIWQYLLTFYLAYLLISSDIFSGTLSRAMKQHITDHNSTCMHMSSPFICCHILSSIFQVMVQNLS